MAVTTKTQTPSLNNFETALTGGHPNSLGNTIVVVEEILQNPDRIEELYQCYFSKDEVVRLRVSSAFKRIAKEKPELVVPFLDSFISEISKINQASTQWTFAQLFLILKRFISQKQLKQAIPILQKNLTTSNDWIVLNFTMEALDHYSKNDQKLHSWLILHLERLSQDSRKSVAARATKYLKNI